MLSNILYTIGLGYLIWYVVVSIGITFGYHRYFSHKEFKASPAIEIVMLYFGLLCGCRSPLGWAGVHRMHHQFSDTEKDPHSKKHHPWYVIVFSMWRVPEIQLKYVKDLIKNKRVMFFHKYRYNIYFVNAVILFAIFGTIALYILALIYILSYLGFGLLNYFGHDAKGPANKIWINLIAPFEGNHKDHHEVSSNAMVSRTNR